MLQVDAHTLVVGLHASHSVVSHVSHSTPPVPHAVLLVPVPSQVPTLPGPLEQHPVGQLAAVQTQPVPPALQVCRSGRCRRNRRSRCHRRPCRCNSGRRCRCH